MRRQNYFLLIALTLVGLMTPWSPYGGLPLAEAAQRAPIQLELPPTALTDLQGLSQPLDQWRGKVVIINFWATWCPPCRREIPEFIALQQELGPKGVQFVGIAIDAAQPVQRYAERQGINYPTLLGEERGMELSMQLGNWGAVLPYSVIFNRQGALVHYRTGAISRSQLRAPLKIVIFL